MIGSEYCKKTTFFFIIMAGNRDEEERKREKEEAAKAELKRELDKYWKAVKVSN